MIGIVVVSHSRALAHAAVELALDMVPVERRPVVTVAAGLDPTTFGTDAVAVADAIATAGQLTHPFDGVLVLADLGSAVLSAEMALEFLDDELAQCVHISSAPLVEGLVAAVVAASSGAGLDAVDAEARQGLLGKQAHLGHAHPEEDPRPAAVSPNPGAAAATGAVPGGRIDHVLHNVHGLHQRPAAALVTSLAGLDAVVLASNASRGHGPVPAASIVALGSLDLRRGDVLRIEASGPDADLALDSVRHLVDIDFGDALQATPGRDGPQLAAVPLACAVTAPVHRMPSAPQVLPPAGGDAGAEHARLERAVDAVNASLTVLPHRADPAIGALVEQITDAQRTLLSDPALLAAVHDGIDAGRSAATAVVEAFGVHERVMEQLGEPYLRERAQDLRSLSRLAVRALAGQELLTLPHPRPHVLCGTELDAATAALLQRDTTLAVLTTATGTTGHGAIIVAALGIPLLAGVPDADRLTEGERVSVHPDGTVERTAA